MSLVLAVEIVGARLRVAVGGSDGTLTGRAEGAAEAKPGPGAVRDALPALVDGALQAAGRSAEELRGAVIATADELPDDGLPGFLKDRWNVPAAIHPDVVAAARAEASLGAAREGRNVLYVRVGSGVAGARVLDGRVEAVALGQTWVPDPSTRKPEKLDQVAGGWAIGRRAALRAGRDYLAAPEVWKAAEGRDPDALAVARETCDALGLGLANALALLRPEKAILAIEGTGPVFWDTIRRKVKTYAPRHACELVPAALDEDAPLFGALMLAPGA